MFGLFSKKNGAPLVLHVDDEQDIRELVAVILERFGLKVVGAEHAKDALELCRSVKPDLILLDIVMPGVDGFDLCRRFKTDAKLKAVPILMVTALDQVKDVEKALSAGANGYITKPFEPPKMRAKIAEFLTLPEPA